jgi:membrane-associated protease RseP (regulator of RpoE activity)
LDQWFILLYVVIIFWSLLFISKRFLPKSVEVHPLFVMWKTTKFNDIIDRLGRALKPLWKVLWNLGTAISIGGSIYITYFLARNLFYLSFKVEGASPVTLLIPGITLSLSPNTLFFFGLSISIILISHELSHGVASRAEGIRVKSTGLILLAIIPGAFVEPDEEDLNKAKKSSQARVYAAGSTTNILIALIALGLMLNAPYVLSPFYQTNPIGIQVPEIVAGSPADGVLKTWDVILSVNGSATTETQSFAKILNTITPNSTVPIVVMRDGEIKTFNFKLGYSAETNSSYIGIINAFSYYPPKYPYVSTSFPFYLVGSLSWIYLLSLNVGLVNMMPITSLDGDKLTGTLINFVLKDKKKSVQVSKLLGWCCLAILVLNISLSFVIFPSFKFG